jgi:hypothetical protein
MEMSKSFRGFQSRGELAIALLNPLYAETGVAIKPGPRQYVKVGGRRP